MSSYRTVKQRSGDRCEAMVAVGLIPVYTRCFAAPVQVHHMLTRARGGLLLDDVGESMHLIALCAKHHNRAHSLGGHEAGLMIDGYVTTKNGRPVYEGSHQGLLAKYGSMDMSKLRKDVPSNFSG